MWSPPHYGLTAVSINRACNARPKRCGNPNRRCKHITEKDIKDVYYLASASNDIVKWTTLRKAYAYDCYNAFWDLNLGNCKYGIYGQCVSETLHSIENGVLKQALSQLFDIDFGAHLNGNIDSIVQWHSRQPWQRGQKQFGRIRFPTGITKLTFTTATEKTMVATALIMALCTDLGRCQVTRKFPVCEAQPPDTEDYMTV